MAMVPPLTKSNTNCSGTACLSWPTSITSAFSVINKPSGQQGSCSPHSLFLKNYTILLSVCATLLAVSPCCPYDNHPPSSLLPPFPSFSSSFLFFSFFDHPPWLALTTEPHTCHCTATLEYLQAHSATPSQRAGARLT
jgi:hypothetical protein